MITPLQGSKIQVDYELGYEKLTVPHDSGGFMRYFVGAFLLFWLGGWTMGWLSAASELFRGSGGVDGFLIFWLGGWTIGGIFAIYYLYRIFRPAVPETIILASPTMVYDSGIEPLQVKFGYRNRSETWKKFFQKRKRFEFTPEEISTIKLREFENGNRLTIDHGHERIEFALGISELEREWLFNVLQKNYNL
jgi:hypothetical protein